MNYDYSIHSDFLIHWAGKDIDTKYDQPWYESDKSKTNKDCSELYIRRLHNILKYGLWMTGGEKETLCFDKIQRSIPSVPKTCFTDLSLANFCKLLKYQDFFGLLYCHSREGGNPEHVDFTGFPIEAFGNDKNNAKLKLLS